MDRTAFFLKFGRSCFGLALMAMGIEQFIYGHFIVGRAPAWPQGIPGEYVWACISGAIFLLAGLSIQLGRRARAASMLSGIVILVWALLRHIPVLLSDIHNGMEWTNAGKAFALCGASFVIAASFPPEAPLTSRSYRIQLLADKLFTPGKIFIALFLIVGGIQHFIYLDFVATLVPAWIPGHLFWTSFAAIALLAAGLGLILPFGTRIAALLAGLMILIWVFSLHLPRAIGAIGSGNDNEITSFFEALGFSGVLLVVYVIARQGAPLRSETAIS